MSFIAARYSTEGGRPKAVLAGGESLAVAALEAADGHDVLVGIRPENYRVAADGPLALEVEVVEPTGPETHVIGSVAGQEVRCVFRERLMPSPGEIVRLTASPENVHLFDAKSGQRLN
jgi:multiple sugar transport system ATP-binding protein